MSDSQWQVVDESADPINAEILRGLLESQSIRVHLSQEGAGRAIGFTVGPMSDVQILVPTEDYEKAKKMIAEFYQDQEE